ILVKVDRAAMMNSLEVRVPLLDYRVVEFAARVPNALRIHEGRQKVMLRRLLQRLVPDWVLDKPKQGFGVPIGDWFRGQGADEFLTTMQSDQARSREFVNPEYVRRLISEHRRGPRDLSTRIWSLLCLELWLEHWRGSVQHRAA
ncbi:MAG: asparagine synthase-related protein, partial [Pseudomonadota bacterium]